MQNIKLIIEYDGTAYAGWQSQLNQPTVQDEIEAALKKLLGQKTTLHGAGRTDAGVHALGQVANFSADSTIPPDKFAVALKRFLPEDILIRSSSAAPDDFHARFGAVKRRYRYRLGFERTVLERNRRWETPGADQPSLEKLQTAAKLFSGNMDCAALCLPSSLQESNLCDIFSSTWSKVGEEYHYEISANRFLHSMVRTIVGFCVRSAQTDSESVTGSVPRLTIDRLRDILKAGTWTTDHLIAPAQGLYLVEVLY